MSENFFAAAAGPLVSVGAANEKDPVILTDDQLDLVTGGTANDIVASNVISLVNGSGLNQFSPSIVSITQTNVATATNLFTVD